MQTKVFSWLGREFVEVSGEARPGASAADQTEDLFRHIDQELHSHGLSLNNGVRIRVWGRDKQARTGATAARAKILTGSDRAASSSFISERRFDSAAAVAVDLLAMRASRADAERKAVDFNPARNYLCYLRHDSVMFASGFTSEAETLEKQLAEILRAIAGAMAIAAFKWDNLVRLSCFLRRDQKIETVKAALATVPAIPKDCELEFSFVDGFAGDNYLIEIEATAVLTR